jgi:hypothetical protein
MCTLAVRDETVAGEQTHSLTLDFLSERITVRELIRSRVFQEVKDHNVQQNRTTFRGLVQPSDAERELNGYRLRKPRQLNWKKQFEIALAGFEQNGFLILIDDHQAENLDEEFDITPDTQVSFVRLVPLIGG